MCLPTDGILTGYNTTFSGFRGKAGVQLEVAAEEKRRAVAEPRHVNLRRTANMPRRQEADSKTAFLDLFTIVERPHFGIPSSVARLDEIFRAAAADDLPVPRKAVAVPNPALFSRGKRFKRTA